MPHEQIFVMLDRILEGLIMLDSNLNFIYVNKTAADLLGKKEDEIIGKNVYDVTPAFQLTKSHEQVISTLEDGNHREWEEFFPYRNLWLQSFAYKTSKGLQIFFRDITKRKAAEKIIQEEKERFSHVVRATDDSVWDWDLVTDFIWWNDNFYQNFGFAKTKETNSIEFWNESIHPEDREKTIESINEIIEKRKEHWSREYRFKNSNGGYSFILDRGYIIYDEKGNPIRMIGAMMDITSQRKYENQLRELSSRIYSVVEAERSRLAREIHDEIGQQLSLLKLELNRTRKFIVNKNEEAVYELDRAMDTLNSSLKSVKNLSYELHPQLIRELGIKDAVVHYINNVSERSGIPCEIQIDSNFEIKNLEYALTIYRIIQEALSNIFKHAKATDSQVTISAEKDYWKIVISDNGIGINTARKHKISLGITGMKERAEMINCSIEILNNLISGTSVILKIPYSQLLDK
jgi:two-component system sensor histidine kinase UhpB